jgi:hypothetical protein
MSCDHVSIRESFDECDARVGVFLAILAPWREMILGVRGRAADPPQHRITRVPLGAPRKDFTPRRQGAKKCFPGFFAGNRPAPPARGGASMAGG